VTNEILQPGLSRLGGFGFAALSVPTFFQLRPSLGVDAVIVACKQLNTERGQTVAIVNGVRVLLRQESSDAWLDALRRESLDLLLCIDYRPSYDRVLEDLERTPVVVWVRDPRTRDDLARIQTLVIPGNNGAKVPGISQPATRRFRRVALRSMWRRRAIAVAYTSPDLASKFWGCYGLPAWSRTRVLPNILEPTVGPMVKSSDPLVVFLGRLDPIKRPWIAVELARAMPDLRFAILGNNHFPDAWQLRDPPPNLQVVGHLDGGEKTRLLSQAWVLLNPGIHEGLPVSFLEALSHEVAIVSAVNPGGIVSSYGIQVPMAGGDGLESLPAYSAAVRKLVDDRGHATRLGKAGREWVRAHHSPDAFMRSWSALCRRLGTRWEASNEVASL
jgi:glycosyltransferase involved in cell wall biosynthesis